MPQGVDAATYPEGAQGEPRMKAESMSSKECVALPSTSESMRVQAIS